MAVALGARASQLSNDAGSSWQTAAREEVKSAAAATEDIRFVYQDEAPVAFTVASARIRADEAGKRAATATPEARTALRVEAAAQAEYVHQTAQGALEDVVGPKYRLPKGGFDAPKRLVDRRNTTPDLVRLNPDIPQREGDHLSRHAFVTILATIPAAIAFLLAALVEVFPRRRHPLLVLSAVALAGAAIWGLGIEVAYA